VSGLAASLETAQPAASAGDNVGAATATTGAGNGAQGGEAQAGDGSLGNRMIGAMGIVTQGLATAFDTTFVALVMAIMLLFPAESLKRVEYGMLDRIESFTNDALLRRLSDEPDDTPLSPEMAKLLEPAFRRHQQWLLEWQTKVSELGNVIGRDFERHAQRFQEQLSSLSAGRVEDARQTVQSLGQAVEGMTQGLAQFREVSDRAAQNLHSSLAAAQALQQQLAANTDRMAGLAQQLNGQSPGGASHDVDRLASAADALQRAAAQLSDLASAAGTDGAMLATGASAASRRGLFGIFKR
jgi:hypothetical protein